MWGRTRILHVQILYVQRFTTPLGRDMDMEFERATKLLRKDGFMVETWETDDYVNCKIYW